MIKRNFFLLLSLSGILLLASAGTFAQNKLAINERKTDQTGLKDFTLTFDNKGLRLTQSVSRKEEKNAAEIKLASIGEEVLKSDQNIRNFATVMGRGLSRKIPTNQTLVLRFSSDGKISSSNPQFFQTEGPYEEYKRCVGETWWAPVVAQLLCLGAYL